MSKKIIWLIVFFVVIAAVAGGIFWWKNNNPIQGSANDYIINGQVVTNKKAGLSFEIPDEWIVEKIDELEGSVMIYSPDTEFIKPRTAPIKKGCVLDMGIIYRKINFDEFKKEIDDIHFGLGVKSEEFEIITINNTQALKNTFDTVFMGKGTAVYVPNKNKFYSFAVYAGPDEEEQCLQDFDTFLNKISY